VFSEKSGGTEMHGRNTDAQLLKPQLQSELRLVFLPAPPAPDSCGHSSYIYIYIYIYIYTYTYIIINIIDTLNCCQKPFTDTNNMSLGQEVSIMRTLVIIVHNAARNYKTNVYTVLVQTNEGKRPHEKPRGGQNITTDFEETGRRGMDWFHLARDR